MRGCDRCVIGRIKTFRIVSIFSFGIEIVSIERLVIHRCAERLHRSEANRDFRKWTLERKMHNRFPQLIERIRRIAAFALCDSVDS